MWQQRGKQRGMGGLGRGVVASLLGSVALFGLVVGLVLAAAGDLDPRFGENALDPGKAAAGILGYDEAYAVALQPNGGIVVAGTARSGPDEPGVFALARFVSDGTLDLSFGPGGSVTTQIREQNEARAIAIQPDGKIVVVGTSHTPNCCGPDFTIARYNPDGSLDAGFGGGGVVLTDFGEADGANAVAIQPDGKIVVAGFTYSDRYNVAYPALARYEPDGKLDYYFGYTGQFILNDFMSDGKISGATALALQPDGKIVMAAPTRRDPNYVGRHQFGLARFTVDGVLDPSFGNGGKVTTSFGGENGDTVTAVAIQPDGKIVAAGIASLTGSNNDLFGLARYNADGSLDTSFSGDGRATTAVAGAVDDPYAVGIQTDGKLVAAGFAMTATGAQQFGLVRYNADGNLDTSFSGDGKLTTNFGGAEEARALAIQPDGRIVVAGSAELNSGSRFFVAARYLAQ